VVIFYGSQTGTAEEFAGRLAKDCNRYGMKGMAADPEEFDMVCLTVAVLCYTKVVNSLYSILLSLDYLFSHVSLQYMTCMIRPMKSN